MLQVVALEEKIAALEQTLLDTKSTLSEQLLEARSRSAALEAENQQLRQQLGQQATVEGEKIQKAHTRSAALETEIKQLRQQLGQQAAVEDDAPALRESLRRMKQELREAKEAATSRQSNEASLAQKLEDTELEVAGLKAQLHLLQAGSATAVNGHGKTSNGYDKDSLLQQLKEVEAQRDKLDSEADEWAQVSVIDLGKWCQLWNYVYIG